MARSSRQGPGPADRFAYSLAASLGLPGTQRGDGEQETSLLYLQLTLSDRSDAIDHAQPHAPSQPVALSPTIPRIDFHNRDTVSIWRIQPVVTWYKPKMAASVDDVGVFKHVTRLDFENCILPAICTSNFSDPASGNTNTKWRMSTCGGALNLMILGAHDRKKLCHVCHYAAVETAADNILDAVSYQ
jgi:hypothetical protein